VRQRRRDRGADPLRDEPLRLREAVEVRAAGRSLQDEPLRPREAGVRERVRLRERLSQRRRLQRDDDLNSGV
jgi:hypothetical protein